MSRATLAEGEAYGVIRARLARPPQDMLEAAVVLEAWGGLPAQSALETARRVMRELPAEGTASVGRAPAVAPRAGAWPAAVAFLLATVAIAGWAGPLGAAVGAAALTRALTLALPLTLGLQWALQSRYLGRRGGLAQLGRRRVVLAVGAYAIVAFPAAALGVAGLVGGLLTLTWVGGLIVMRRGWAGVYAAYILLGTLEMHAGLPALPVLACMSGATVAAAAMAVRDRVTAGSRAGSRGRAAAAAAMGGGLGVMLVADGSVNWGADAAPALALLPSAVGGFWAGRRLQRLGDVMPRAAAGVPVTAADRHGPTGAPLRLLAGSVWRLAVATTGLSAALLLFTPWLGEPGEAAGVLAAFGLLALAMLLVSLLDGFGRPRAALLAIACAVCAELLVTVLGEPPFPGAPLLAGAGLAAAATAPATIALLRRPGRTLATSLWIA